MTGPGFELLMLLSIGLIVPVRIYSLFRYTWNLPLRNGPGFFLGVEVPAGFYDGPKTPWLRRYHQVLLAELAIEGCILAVLLALAKWQYVPMWAGGSAVLYVGAMFLFMAWTRHSLGAAPPVRPVALALKTRRLGDYISWPLEALTATLVAFSWWLLLRHGGTRIDLFNPLEMTWIVLGLLPGKIATVRSSSPPSRGADRRALSMPGRRQAQWSSHVGRTRLVLRDHPPRIRAGAWRAVHQLASGADVVDRRRGAGYDGVPHGDGLPGTAADGPDGPRPAPVRQLGDAISRRQLDEPARPDLVRRLVWRHSGIHPLSAPVNL